jgi:hypothetical protein
VNEKRPDVVLSHLTYEFAVGIGVDRGQVPAAGIRSKDLDRLGPAFKGPGDSDRLSGREPSDVDPDPQL